MIILTAVIPLTTLMVINNKHLAAERSIELAQNQTEMATLYIETALKEYEAIIEIATNQVKTQLGSNNKFDQELIGNIMNPYTEQYDSILNMYIGTEDKEMYLFPDVQLPDGYDPTMRPWYTSTIRGALNWTSPYVDVATGESIISVSIPLLADKTEQPLGVVGMDISLTDILQPVHYLNIAGQDTYSIVVDSDFIIVDHPNLELVGYPIPNQHLIDSMTGNEAGVAAYSFNNETKLTAYQKVESPGLYALTSQSMYYDEQSQVIIMIGSLIGVFATFMTVFTISFIMRSSKPHSKDSIDDSYYDNQSIDKTQLASIASDLKNAMTRVDDLMKK